MSANSPEVNTGLAKQLAAGCESLGLATTPEQQALLLEYLALLVKWNKAYNLTAVRDERQMVTRHLLDSLVIAPYIHESRLLDVGSGAGLPGVPLAILFPEKVFHLLDSNGKKTRFLFQVKTALGLDNIRIHQARVESFDEQPFQAVLSRAFASLADMVRQSRHLLASGGRYLAMKGASPGQELEELKAAGFSATLHALVVPGLDESRHLVEIHPPEGVQCPSTSELEA